LGYCLRMVINSMPNRSSYNKKPKNKFKKLSKSQIQNQIANLRSKRTPGDNVYEIDKMIKKLEDQLLRRRRPRAKFISGGATGLKK